MTKRKVLKNLLGLVGSEFDADCAFDLEEWKALKRLSDAKSELVDIFYMSLRAGKSPDDAKRDQFSFCAGRPEYISAYNAIYN